MLIPALRDAFFEVQTLDCVSQITAVVNVVTAGLVQLFVFFVINILYTWLLRMFIFGSFVILLLGIQTN